MSKSTTTYQRLGDYIQEVDVRNKDLAVERLVGLTIDKSFIPSVANIIGTDLSKYKIIRREQFACSLMQVSRDGKMPIAMFNEDESIMSPAYPMFEVVDKEELLPQYLMMWFSRKEFDREAAFYAVGGVRGSLTWEDFCDMRLPVPPIERQREIVEEYETLSRRIRLCEDIISRLEATAQALYHKMFVADIDPNKLPQGWRMGTLGDVADITMGQSPEGFSYNEEGLGEIFYQGRSDFGLRFPSIRMFTTQPIRMAEVGDLLLSVRAPVGYLNLTLNKCCIGRGLAAIRSRNGANSFLFYSLQSQKEFFNSSNDNGTVFGSINKDNLYSMPIVIPCKEATLSFIQFASKIDEQIENYYRESQCIHKILSLILGTI